MSCPQPPRTAAGRQARTPMVRVRRSGRCEAREDMFMMEKIQAHPARARDERGMAAVEYAVGVVLIIVIIGAIILSIQGNWFGDLVQKLVAALVASVTEAFELPSGLPFGK